MTVLGIESSCDETSAAICLNGKITNNLIATQSIHEEYGGVVPELASREHLRNIVPIVETVLKKGGLKLTDVDAIACTQGPGLLGSLLVGYTFSKTLAFSLEIPLINIHHIKAHILAHFIDDPKPQFPFLCLIVSGGHTQIVKVESVAKMQILGQTRDDAVGEAFDKGAKLLGLQYPGGPLLDKIASDGNPERFEFSESRLEGLDFSFSGIKTSLLYFLNDQLKSNKNFVKDNLNDLCASYQKILIDMLEKKVSKAAKQENINRIAIAGGVAANSQLRTRFKGLAEKNRWELFIPDIEYCTDNAAMVAQAGYLLFDHVEPGKHEDSPLPRMAF